MTPEVAVIIVSYNQGLYLRQAVDSVLHQTKHVGQIILVNNGSTDNTEELLRKYVELYYPIVTSYSFAHNAGAVRAFNKGLEHVTAPFACFLDADDELDHTYIAKMSDALKKDDSAAIAYSDFHLYGPRERSAYYLYPREWRQRMGTAYVIRAPDYSESVKYELKRRNYIHNAALFRVEVAKQVGGVVEHTQYSLRHFMWYRIFDAGHTGVHVVHPLFRYRQHSILQASWQWRVRKIDADNPIDQQIIYFQEEVERLKNSSFYKTEQVLKRLTDNFKCDCEK
jgi:glycosyltransferase involved in cell wall biosynthesis